MGYNYCRTIYRIFSLLSACAYISTGRKLALNNEVRLTKNSYIKNACAFAVSLKGRGQSIVHVAQVEMAFVAGRT